ncbi:hypothetical protein HOLleu_08910 [Holothuria leucospilota]|uniref:Sulfotransferase family protein n=1 Tax=Holothuria leucospilota TaxID=206669 RepID=A0A9Q1CIY9_HOLLE|nr:hypothetical protein HOLleu_08910 [Holothuria leucospilota]
MAANSEDQVCVFLWALPRSMSTAMTKCMSFVDGIQIWHEPYLYSYHNEKFKDPVVIEKMRKMGMDLEGLEKTYKEIIKDEPAGKRIRNNLFSFPWVKKQLETQDPDKKFIFVKDMAHVLNNKYDYLRKARKFRHTFLIRHPSRMYPSFKNMMFITMSEDEKSKADILRDVLLYDVDKIYKYTYDLWKYTQQNFDPDAIIIDGTELATYPEKLLPKYFEAVGIPFKEKYLTWSASPDVMKEWKAALEEVTYVYRAGIVKRAMESSHFIAPDNEAPPRADMTPDVIKCVEESLPYFNEMFEQRIRP